MWNKIVTTVMELVAWAERELSGKTGAEKRKAVVEKAVVMINIPFVPDFLETPIERVVYGYLIDRAVGWFNLLGNGVFGNLFSELNFAQVGQVVDLINTDVVPVEEILEDIPEISIGISSVDDKLNALYAKYAGK
jgi:hypothetical protein